MIKIGLLKIFLKGLKFLRVELFSSVFYEKLDLQSFVLLFGSFTSIKVEAVGTHGFLSILASGPSEERLSTHSILACLQ